MASILAFVRNVFDVTMVRIPHCSIADAIASLPAVKFKFTGTRPASVNPMFASAAAADGGSSTPIISLPVELRRAQSDTSRLPVSARPCVSSRPLESAIANRFQFRRADRMKRSPSVSPCSLRRLAASAPNSITAWRTSCAFAPAGIGSPNDTVTG